MSFHSAKNGSHEEDPAYKHAKENIIIIRNRDANSYHILANGTHFSCFLVVFSC